MKTYSAVILSAGYSSRMRAFKPLMNLGGTTPLQRCIDLFYNCGIEEIIVVTGHLCNQIDHYIGAKQVRTVVNPNFSEGMFTSIQTGIGALSASSDAFFILPVDIPSVKEHTVRRMIDRFEGITDGILFPLFREEKGHPVLISRSFTGEILSSRPEGGLREILSNNTSRWHFEPFADRGILLDMDTKEDFQLLQKHISAAPFPDYEECMELLRLNHVKPGSIEHMKCVGEFAKKVAILLNEKGYHININAVYAGGLLHDIAKGMKHHEEEGAKTAEHCGYPDLCEIISQHSALKSYDRITEKEIVFLCDKLIKETKPVSLEERFEVSFRRYEKEPEILENVKRRYETASAIKQEIEAVLAISLESMI